MSTSPKNMYNEIFQILKDEGINNLSDFERLKSRPVHVNWGMPPLDSEDFPWVKEIFQIVENIVPNITNNNEIDITVENAFETEKEKIKFVSGYGCLFPERVAYICRQFVCDEYEEWFSIPRSFFTHLFLLRPALESNLTYLVPQRTKYDDSGFLSTERTGTYYWREKLLGISEHGTNENELKGISKDIKEQYALVFPHINNLDLNRFVELVKTHEKEYKNYNMAFKKICGNSKIDERTFIDWQKEATESLTELTEICRKQRKEYIKKGLELGFGFVLSIGSIWIPNFPQFLQMTIPPKTLYEGYELFKEINQNRTNLRKDDHWILWKMANKNASR